MNEFYYVAWYSKGYSRYFNSYELAQQAFIAEGYSEGDVIYLMQLNGQGEYEIAQEFDLPLEDE